MFGHGCPQLPLQPSGIPRPNSIAIHSPPSPDRSAGDRAYAWHLLLDRAVFGTLVLCWLLTTPTPSVTAKAVAASHLHSSPAATGDTNTVAVRHVRCQWNTTEQQTYIGAIRVIGGQLKSYRALSAGAASGRQFRQSDQDLKIQYPGPTDFGGVDLWIETNDDQQTIIRLELSTLETPGADVKASVRLSELSDQPIAHVLGRAEDRVLISRPAADLIQVNVGRRHLVFDTAENWQLRWRPNWRTSTTKPVTGNLSLRSMTSPQEILHQQVKFTGQPDGNWSWQTTNLTLPDQEGVYQLWLSVDRSDSPSDAGRHARSSASSATRKIEFLTLQATPAKRQSGRWELVERIKLATDYDHELINPKKRVKERLLPPIPLLAFGPSLESLAKRLEKKQAIGNEHREIIERNGQHLLLLQKRGWQAIPLRFAASKVPYAIEIDYLIDGPLSLGLSLLEQNGAGQVTADGFDSGVFVPNSIVANPNQNTIKTHRFVVWPNSKKSHLLMVNRHLQHAVAIDEVRLLKTSGALPRIANRFSNSQATGSDPAPEPNPQNQRRQWFAMVENIDFQAEYHLDGTGDSDLETRQKLDDWTSYYQATERLVQQLKSGGYDGAYVTVMSDGWTLFPSDLIQPSLRYDNGRPSTDRRDPIHRDVLEMMFRMFQRQGLQLIPMLAFNRPLPSLERLRSPDRPWSSLNLVNRAGQPPNANALGQLPVYNPLNVQVQRATEEIVLQLGQRYQHFESYNGVALACRPDTFALLPGSRWGYDDITVRSFLQSLPSSTPTENPTTSTDPMQLHKQAWLRWRCQRMSDWYSRMGQHLAEQTGGKLFVAPIDIQLNQEMATQLAPNLHRSIDMAAELLKMGLVEMPPTPSAADLQSATVVRLVPHRLAFDRSTVRHRANAAIKNAQQIDAVYRHSGFAGDLFHHRGHWSHFVQLQSRRPFVKQKTPLIRMQRLNPGQQYSRQRFVESIKKQDSLLLVDGGWTASTGDDGCDEVMAIYRQLPRRPFQDVPHVQWTNDPALPAAIRQYLDRQAGFFYIANASPIALNVRLTFENTDNAMPIKLSSLSQAVFQPVSDLRQTISVQVPAYGLVAAKHHPSHRLKNYSFAYQDDFTLDLRKRITGLQLKLQQALHAPPLSGLKNADFTNHADSSVVPEWEFGQQPNARFQLIDQAQPNTSQPNTSQPKTLPTEVTTEPSMYLRITHRQSGVAWIRSSTLAPTTTGRLSIAVWLRVRQSLNDDEGHLVPPGVRVVVDGQTENGGYYRFGAVDGIAIRPDNAPSRSTDASRWKRFAVHFDGIPDDLTDLRIGFDINGQGEVDIAKVRVYDRWLDRQDGRAITQLLASADAMLRRPEQLDRCRRLLNEYWAVFLDEHFELPSLSRHARQRFPMFRQKTDRLNQ